MLQISKSGTMSSDEEDFFSSFRKKEEERVAILIAETENKVEGIVVPFYCI